MFITITELRLYFNKSIILSAVFLAMLSFAAGIAGSTLLYKDKLVPKFTLYIVDNDNSVESRLLLESLKSFKTDTMTVLTGDSKKAEEAVLSGEASAALLIPENFFADIMSGVNSDAELMVNRENEAVSELITLFAESIKEQLSAAQAGIYHVLSKAPDNNEYTKFMQEANIVFLSTFMVRSIDAEKLEPFGAVSIRDYFTFCFFIFAMFIISSLFIEKGNVVLDRQVFELLLAKAISFRGLFGFKLLAVAISYFLLNTLIIGVMAFTGILDGAGAFGIAALVIMLTFIQSAFCNMLIWFFKDIKAAGVFIFFSSLCSLFFSGGLLPLVFLPEAIKSFARFTPNYYLTSFFISVKTGSASLKDAAAIAAFAVTAVAVSYIIANVRKGKAV